MPIPPKNINNFDALTEIVKTLRGPDGCPWDKEQNHETLTQYAIEEAYELAEAIDNKQKDELIEELGDLLLQVVLHSEIASQNRDFTIEDVITSICAKMIRRHPHVFANEKAETSQEVLANWQIIKNEEKRKKKTPINRFDIPTAIPALIRSQKIGTKTHNFNFDWNTPHQVFAKVEEEVRELKEALQTGTSEEKQFELGDLLFSLAQLARHLNFDAEQALRQTNTRFEKRFFKMLELMKLENIDINELSSEQKESYWQKAKLELKS